MRQRLLFVCSVLVIAGWSSLLGRMAARAQFANVERGFSPSGMFDMGGLDAVNGFNGNLVIHVPIGTTYPVGGIMGSYSFGLVYNSNPWNYVQKQGTPCPQNAVTFDTVNIVSPNNNAGLGWNFSLGNLGTDQTQYTEPPPPAFFGYHGPDGSVHYLFDHLTTPGGGTLQQTGMSFSNDGSFLRYHQQSDGTSVLEFPDGRQQVRSGNTETIKDPFGNGLTITYTTDPQTCPGNVWAITDGYRTHRVCFRPTGYTSPDEQTEVVDHIDVAAFSGSTPSGTATYRFLYNDADQNGNGFHEIRFTGTGTRILGCNDPWQPPRVMLLTQLLLPDGTSYRMPSAVYTQQPMTVNGIAQTSYEGVLTQLSLPTSGSIGWAYELKNLPSPHTDENGLWYIPAWSSVPGVGQRSLYDTGNQLIGTWHYNQGAAAEGVTAQLNELVNEVVFPSPDPVLAAQGVSGHRIVTYYSACVYGQCIDAGTPYTYAADFGLPFSRRRPDGTGLYLSQEIYASAGTPPIRQIYVNYDNDTSQNPPPADQASPIYANQRPQAQRTLYLDDPVPGTNRLIAVSTVSSNYDSLGHYRTVDTSDTTSWLTHRTETTDWNPGGAPPDITKPWILDTYDFRQQQEGSDVERQEVVFEPGTGFLFCERRLKSGTNRSRRDVVVTYGHDAAGQVTVENWFGGDAQAVSAAAGCVSLPNQPAYSFGHGYSSGVRNLTTTVLVDGTQLKILDNDVDPGTGFVSTTREPAAVPAAGRSTFFTHDSMGRLTTVAPQGDAATQLTYTLNGASPPFIDLRVGGNLLEEMWRADGLGRIVAHTVLMPNQKSLTSMVTLNAMGWKTFESEPAQNPGSQGTSYLDFDAFGRPGRIVAADHKTTYLGYHGISSIVRTQGVWTGTREYPFNTREEYDGLGRLHSIQDPTGVWTRYRYDVAGRLNTVTTNGLQTRNFTYDGRGFLVAEQNPESGVVTYQYDARANVTKKMTPTGTLTSVYDGAGRLFTVSTPQALIKQFLYGTGSQAGKLKEASAFNYRMGSICSATEVRQDYFYSSSTGRLSTEGTSLWQGAAQLESWTQSYAYDGAGKITTVTYPSCTWLCSSPSRTVTTAYTYGKPTSVAGFASSITYNDNGTLATIAHADSVFFTETADLNGMVRPGSLRADGPNQTTPWPQETYSFDTAGNIKAIGAKTYAYDGNSRIVSATVPTSVVQPYQGFTYDAYGNLTSVASGANAGSATTVFYQPASCDTTAHCTNRLTGALYDNSGELTGYQGSTYAWDALGQVTSLYNGSEVWTHLYDANGERVWSYRTSPSRLDTYALRGQDGKILSVYSKTGSTYTWEDYAYREGQVLGAAFSDGHLVHFDVDHLGSVRLETGGSGTTYRDFWPYGSEATPPGGTERMKFAGQERDLGNLTSTVDDIDFMHARYYRPLFGRFLSPDPHAGSAAAPKTWNRYSYAAGNPLRFTDPTGKYLCSDKSACQDFENARVADLNDPETGAAAEAFGKLGEDNGVTVKFGEPEENSAADTKGHIEANKEGTKMLVKATTTVRPGTKGISLEATVAHEGTHLMQWNAWAASWDMSKGTYDMSKNITRGEGETAAYKATNRVFVRHQMSGNLFGCKGCNLGVVNKVPAQVEAAINRILTDPASGYNNPPKSSLSDRLDPNWK